MDSDLIQSQPSPYPVIGSLVSPLHFHCLSETLHFYRAAWNADAVYSDENYVRQSVCLSVCLSVCQTHEL